MNEPVKQKLPAIDLDDAELEMLIAERVSVSDEWGVDRDKPIAPIQIAGIDHEANKRIRLRLIAALGTIAALENEVRVLTQKGGSLCSTLGNLGIRLHDLGLRSIGQMGAWEYCNERAELAESTLAERDREIEALNHAVNYLAGWLEQCYTRVAPERESE